MRHPRNETAGGLYHVYNRGNNGLFVFADDDDRGAFLAQLWLLGRALEWTVLSYCVLGTHFHLLVKTAEPNLGVGMRDLMGRTARAVHMRRGSRGRVWEDRFKSKVVEAEPYLLHLLRYIALNPVHAGLCSDPAGWKRSGHRALAGGAPDGIVDVAAVHGLLGETTYPYLFDELGEHGPWSNATDPELPRPPLEVILGGTDVLADAMRIARASYRYTVQEIARCTGLSTSTVSRQTVAV